NKIKTVEIPGVGYIRWYIWPSSVFFVKKLEASIIERFKRLELTHFIRVKEEINKEAISEDPQKIEGMEDISIVPGEEVFSINAKNAANKNVVYHPQKRQWGILPKKGKMVPLD
ncbi:MAG TPA: host-nuclease inhibitor Gam family protein, partial [Candidatus Paceibacterota bacterium]|nr:host-nuclease inhibitor Gam family protein [Candidatus Paceibacterota bacterium]